MAQFIKICKICGKQFIASQRKIEICYEPHTLICPICGKEFEVSRKRLLDKDCRKTCSKKCEVELRRRTNQEVYGGNAPACSEEIKNKVKATNQEKYGGNAPACSKDVQEKIKKTNLEKYGVEYLTQNEDIQNKIKQTSLDKYGVERPQQSEVVKQKIQNTTKEHYGDTCFFRTDYFHDVTMKEYEERTGYKHQSENPVNTEHRMKALQEKYGGTGFGSPVIRKHIEDTNIEKYGNKVPTANSDIEKKVQDTCFEKYGNSCYLHSNEGEIKTQKSCIKRYDVPVYVQSKKHREDVMSDPSKIDNLMDFNENPREYVSKNYPDKKPTLNELAKDLGIGHATLGTKLFDMECTDIVDYVFSTMEREVYDELLKIDSNLHVERNTRRIIPPKELDLFLPDYSLGIECNPTASHNSTIGIFENCGGMPKEPDYHKVKTDMCEEQGIFLFHIFGYDWSNHKEIIISILRNLLGKTENKIYARKCEIKDVPYGEANTFLMNNHRQGYASSKIRIGLYYNEELVSLMTFGKMRPGIGTGKEDLSDCYELVRFCNKINTNVVGGASKLFKHFLREYNPARVRSFSDRAHTKGNLYKVLGFHEVRRSDIGYVWVNFRTDVEYNRTTCRKSNLKTLFNDEELDLSKTEKEIMEEHGFVKVFDCGTITWEYDNVKSCK